MSCSENNNYSINKVPIRNNSSFAENNVLVLVKKNNVHRKYTTCKSHPSVYSNVCPLNITN